MTNVFHEKNFTPLKPTKLNEIDLKWQISSFNVKKKKVKYWYVLILCINIININIF
jgi:hypothetical protein